MARKNSRNTKGRIVSAAWKLFYEQGYENTTVEEIIAESGTSKGSFYHYFGGKDALLETLSMIFDEKYEELQEVAESMDAVAALTPQPQVADSLPVKSLIYTVSAWENASAFSVMWREFTSPPDSS